jgi:hypothetical protein
MVEMGLRGNREGHGAVVGEDDERLMEGGKAPVRQGFTLAEGGRRGV